MIHINLTCKKTIHLNIFRKRSGDGCGELDGMGVILFIRWIPEIRRIFD